MKAVDLPLGDDQELLRSTSERFILASCPLERVRALAVAEPGLDQEYLRQSAELGWLAFLIPEEYGGGSVSDLGLADAAIVAREQGKGLQPGPFVTTNVVADALVRGGSESQRTNVLPAIAAGRATASWAIADTSGDWNPGGAVRWSRTKDGFSLRGTATLVQDAAVVDWLLVTAGSAEGLTQFLVSPATRGLRIEKLAGLDLTRQFYRVQFEDLLVASSTVVGNVGEADDLVERQLQVAIVLTVAEMVGAMDRDFASTLQYAKDRTAFGRPIGSFQAIKHLLADTSLLLEASKAVADAAVVAVGEGPYGGDVASVAKAFVGDSAIDLAQNCWQVYGGIGYTWEHDQHLYMRRLTTDALLFGDPAWHRERLCRIHRVEGVDAHE